MKTQMMIRVAALTLILTAGCQTTTESRGRLGNLPTYGNKEVATSEAPAPKLTATTFFAAGNLDEERGNYIQAVQNYERALETSPTFLSARVRLGITLNKLGQHAEASRNFEIAIQQKPTEAYLYNNLGFSMMLEERYADAAKALEHAVDLKPEFARAHMNLAIAYGKLQNFSKARDEFSLACSELDTCFNLAILQKEARRYADAASSLERALEINPRFEPARQPTQRSRLGAPQRHRSRQTEQQTAERRSRQPHPRRPGGAHRLELPGGLQVAVGLDQCRCDAERQREG